MSVFAAILVILSFAWLLRYSGALSAAQGGMAVGREALVLLRDPLKDDEEKESAMRQASLRLFLLTAKIVVGSLLAALPPFLLLEVGAAAGLLDTSTVLSVLLDWRMIVAASIMLLGTMAILR